MLLEPRLCLQVVQVSSHHNNLRIKVLACQVMYMLLELCCYIVMFGETQVWPGLTPFQIMYRVTVRKEKPETAHLPLYMQKICQSCSEEISLKPPSNVVLQRLLSMT